MGLPVPANEVAERAERIRIALEADGGFSMREPTEHGETPITVIELRTRLQPVRPDVAVLGLEIDPARVAAARPAEKPGLSFERGGFELAGRRPTIVRAANVLR